MPEAVKILCVADEKDVLKALEDLFTDEGSYAVRVADSGSEGLEVLEREKDIRLVISDYRLPAMNGIEFLRQVHERCPETLRIVLAGSADAAAVVAAVSRGEIDRFIPKPRKDEEMLSAVSAVLRHQELQRENSKLNEELQRKNVELRKINETLEEQVIKRTEALAIRNRVLQISQGVLDVLPVVVFGIDPEQLIVHCNEYARELFPFGGIGPLGNERQDVFSPEINALIDRLEQERAPKAVIEVRRQKFRAEVRRLHESLSQGVVLVLIPEA